jgi:hypothetical protein
VSLGNSEKALYLTNIMTSESASDIERRGATRHDLHLDVVVDGSYEAITENVSSSGVLLRLGMDAQVGSELVVDMEIPALLGGGGRVQFRAEVVRVEERDDGRAIAARFTDWQVLG